MAFKMKKQSMTQGTTGHKSALKMKAKQDAAMKMKKEAAMKMKQEAAMKMAQQPMQQPMAAPQQPMQQPMQQPAPTMMKKESPTKIVKDIKEGVKYAGKKLKNVKQGASDIKEGFRQLFTGDRTDSRLKKKSPSKLKKPTTRKMDTAEETPRIKRGPESTKRGRGKELEQLKKALSKRKKAPAKFNAKLKAASAAGKLSGEFKKAVDAAPTKMKKKSPATKKGDYLSKAKDRVTNVVDMFKGASGKTNKGNRRSVGGKNVIDTYRDEYLKSKRKTDKKYKK